MSQQRNHSELETKPVGQLLLQYSIPAIIAMTASSLYNIVDSVFIGQGVGPLAISGLAITFPLMNLSAAFGAMVGVGASTLISVKMGQRDISTARHILGNTATLNLILGVVFGFVVLLFLDPVLRFFGASDATLPYARDYMQIILLGNVVTHSYLGFNSVVRSTGHPRMAMIATIATVIINTVLDPLFIYTFGMGIRGAAIATIISQIFALIYCVSLLSRQDEEVHFCRNTYKLSKKIVSNTLAIGMSPFLMNTCACLVVLFINKGLEQYGGDLAIGAYGIVNRIVFFFIMIVIGLNQGMQPIAGFNFGARRIDRVMKVLRYAIIYATAITFTGFVVGEFFPELCARMFTTDKQLIDLSVGGMRIVFMSFLLIGAQMVTTNFFQSIGYAKISIFLSLTRQLIFLLPGLLILPMFLGVEGVWYSLPMADLLSFIVTITMLWSYRKKFKLGKI